MHLLFLSNYFPPEVGSGPNLAFELSESLAERGHRVTVVTGFPRYNLPEMPAEYRGRWRMEEQRGGVRVLRIQTPNLYGKSRLSRGLVQLLAPPFLALGSLRCERPDVVYTVTPPLAMGLAGRLAAARFAAPLVVNVQDLFPQSAIDLGLIRDRRLIGAFRRMERYVYRRAAAITVMSDGNRRHVIDHGASADKVHTVFNWVDTRLIQPAERQNEFRLRHGLGDRFVVLFAGTMGWSQGLEVIVDAARSLADDSQLLFLLVGDGVEKQRLVERAAGLDNVRFLPMQPQASYPELLAAADVCLATLRPEVATPTVPSKIPTIMAAGRPVAASLPPGDATDLIVAADCGRVAPAGDAAALAAAIRTLRNDPALVRRLGDHGRAYALSNLSRQASVDRIEAICSALAPPNDGKVAVASDAVVDR